MDKKALRNKYKLLRSQLSPAQLDQLSGLLIKNLEGLITKQNAQQLFSYRSRGGEPNINGLAAALSDLKFAYPVVDATQPGLMTFHRWSAGDPLRVNEFGISEPDPRTGDLAEPNENTIVLLPGLAFSLNGSRLGYGGGYYDRYLAGFSAVKRVGATFESFLVPKLPQELHDIPVDFIVTERRVIDCPAE